MKTDKIRKVIIEGEKLESWACDCNVKGEMESNGSQQGILRHGNIFYMFFMDWADEIHSIRPLSDRQVNEILEEGGFLADIIKKEI